MKPSTRLACNMCNFMADTPQVMIAHCLSAHTEGYGRVWICGKCKGWRTTRESAKECCTARWKCKPCGNIYSVYADAERCCPSVNVERLPATQRKRKSK